MRIATELLRAAGQPAVLSLLEEGERYGYELIGLIEERSEGIMSLGQSTLYPLLYNLEGKGMIVSRNEISAETNKPRKYYALTEKGQKELAAAREQFALLTLALEKLALVGELEDEEEPAT